MSQIARFVPLAAFVLVTALADEKVLYRPAKAAAEELTRDQALALVMQLGQPNIGLDSLRDDFSGRQLTIERRTIRLTDKKGKVIADARLTSLDPELVLSDGLRIYRFGPAGLVFLVKEKDEPALRRLSDALLALKLAASPVTDIAFQRRFDDAVRVYRSANPKPPEPEAARRVRLQADQALADHNLARAIELYEDAIEATPWWPEGHFNLAQNLADDGRYSYAVIELKRYLQLTPDAPDARAATDLVYRWESVPDKPLPKAQLMFKGRAH